MAVKMAVKNEASVVVGYCRTETSSDYKYCDGIDITAFDDLGNSIEVSARSGDAGYRIQLSGTTRSTVTK